MITINDQPFTGSTETGRRLCAAEGYLFLELYQEAFMELEKVSMSELNLFDVLIARGRTLFHLQRWQRAERIACFGMERYVNENEFIVQRIFALQKLRLATRARRIMDEAPVHLSCSGIIHYNLACYFLRFSGEKDVSLRYLNAAIQINPNIKKTARKDPDLTALWN